MMTKMQDYYGKCERCNNAAVSNPYEYKKDGTIVAHPACIEHMLETVQKYAGHGRENIKW